MQLLPHRVQFRVEDRDHLIEGREQQLEDDGRRIEVILLELGCTLDEMPPSLVERRGVSLPDGHDAPPNAQEVDLDDRSGRLGDPRHDTHPVLTNRHPGNLTEAQRPQDLGGVET
jgi:hypothetical protein